MATIRAENDMDRKATTVRLTKQQAEDLEAVAQVDGISIAEEVREAIEEHISRKRKDEAFQQRLRASIERNSYILNRLAE